MRITFIIANPNMSGGNRVCAIYAKKFKEFGHEVSIVAPKKRFIGIRQQVKRILKGGTWLSKKAQMQNHFDLLDLDVTYVMGSPPLNSKVIPNADVVIATWWETAEWVSRFSSEKGKKVYFIQGHEAYDHLPVDRVEATYKLAMYKITIASWLVALMVKKYSSEKPYLIPNSVDHDLFYSQAREKQEIQTIGFLFSDAELKGVINALLVIGNLKKKIPNLRVIAFGSKAPVTITLPDYVELSINPDQSDICALYQQCDLWLCCSRIEGFGLTILEAMACRTPAVSTKCGGPEDIITEGVNGYLCEVNDVSALTEAAYKILQFNGQEWTRFSTKAYEYANSYSWDEAAKLFERKLQVIVDASAE